MFVSDNGFKMKKRVFTIFIIFSILLFGLIFRTGYIQLVQGEELQKEAIAQQTRDSIINSKRGTIYDRNGVTLAISASAECISITPSEIRANADSGSKETAENIANKFAEILELDSEAVLAKINKNTAYEIIKRKVDKKQADAVRTYINEKSIKGIDLTEDAKRYYPYGNFASHVIGFTGIDNQGLEGLESIFDSELKGVPGRVVSAKNARGMEMPYQNEMLVDAEDGTNVVLTLDESIQHFAEKHLEEAVIENKADKGGACIVIDVKTGEILAMASYPNYDLNNPMEITDATTKSLLAALDGDAKSEAANTALQKLWRNKAVVDTYEPGSTFKIFTSSMALEQGVVSLNENFNCTGSVQVATHTIRCWRTIGHGSQTFVQGVQNSCNPVFIELGRRVGASKFIEYYNGFGFAQRTGIELAGEAQSIFHATSRFNEVELVTSSFGQSFQITPLQMITAVAAVANDGYLMKPHIVKALTNSDNNIVKSYEPEVIRQIISKETSDIMCDVLETVVSQGTGSNAYVSGYRVAGKTGTSEKLPRDSNKYIASFVGFAPADDPQVACLVILDEPMGEQYYGGVIAAPAVGKVLEDTLTYLNIEPLYTQEEIANIETSVPDLYNTTVTEATAKLRDINLKTQVVGGSGKVINQVPKANVRVNVKSIVTIYTEGSELEKNIVVPNVMNCSVSEATQLLINSNLNIKSIGAISGQSTKATSAYKQNPAAGTVVEPGTIITVEFRTLEVGE